MGYVIAAPPSHRLSGLGIVPMIRGEGNLPPYLLYRGGGGGMYRYRSPLPVAPKIARPPTPIAPAPSVPVVQPPSGYCLVTSSPETGGITSVVPCASGQGGVPIPGSSARAPSQTSLVPSTQPLNQPYTDAYGNVWTYGASGWQITGNASSVLPASPVSPVPANYPTSLPYTDRQGNTWTYGTSGWQTSSYGSSAGGGGSYTGGTTTVSTSSGYQSVLDWLSQQTLISGIPNWGIVAAAGAAVLLLKNRGGRR